MSQPAPPLTPPAIAQPALVNGMSGPTHRDSAILDMNRSANLLNCLNNGTQCGGKHKQKQKHKYTQYGGIDSSPSQLVVSTPRVMYNDSSAGDQSMNNQFKNLAATINQANANAAYDKNIILPPYNAKGGRRHPFRTIRRSFDYMGKSKKSGKSGKSGKSKKSKKSKKSGKSKKTKKTRKHNK